MKRDLTATFAMALASAGVMSLLLSWPAFAQELSNRAGPLVTIPGSETRTIHSKIVGQEYALQISLPRGYQESKQRFPVVFLLDAQWDFPLVYSIYGQQYYDGFVPGVILVGISWGGKDPNPDALRRRDFTPTDEGSRGDSGGGARFLSFLEKELIPFVERQYRAADNRTLVGSSLGGLFTLYSLFMRPDLFDNYVATSPATPWDGGVLYDLASGFAERSARNPSRLFIAVSELESLHDPVMQLVARLREANYPGLTWASHVVTGAGHSGVKAEGNTRGLQFVFQRPDVLLTERELRPLVGRYRAIEDGTEIQVEARNDRLWGISSGDQGREYRARDRLHFYYPGELLNVTFSENKNGAIDGFDVEMFQGTMHFLKLTPTSGAPDQG